MLEEIKELISSGRNLTAWELGFLTDIKSQLTQGRTLTEKKENKVKEILEKCKPVEDAVKNKNCDVCMNSGWIRKDWNGKSYAERCQCVGGTDALLRNLGPSVDPRQSKRVRKFYEEIR